MRALGRVPLYAVLPLLVLASRAHAQVLPPRSGNPWLERGSTLEIARQLALAPDTRIDHTNLARFQSMLPGGLALLVRAYGLVLHTRAYAPYVPSRGYVAATKAQHGRVQLRAEPTSGESRLSGYVAGLPFAAPKTALEVAYNLAHAYRGDDATLHFDVTRVTAQGGVESTEEWAAFWMRLAGRTDLQADVPAPAFASGSGAAVWVQPRDPEGVTSRYRVPRAAGRVTAHHFIPAMRRMLPTEVGSDDQAWNGTDYLYVDIGGFLGAPEWMEWTLVQKQVALLPALADAAYGADAAAVFDLDHWPHWNPRVRWQPRPVYVLEATPKVPGYPYPRMRLWVDAESYTGLYKEAYDADGKLWKVVVHGENASAAPHRQPTLPAFVLALNLRTKHATLITYRSVRVNDGVQESDFSLRCRSTPRRREYLFE